MIAIIALFVGIALGAAYTSVLMRGSVQSRAYDLDKKKADLDNQIALYHMEKERYKANADRYSNALKRLHEWNDTQPRF